MDVDTLAGVLSAFLHFPLKMNFSSVNQEWIKGKAGTIIFLICLKVRLILLIVKCQMERSIIFRKTEGINVQVFSVATNFESGEHLA